MTERGDLAGARALLDVEHVRERVEAVLAGFLSAKVAGYPAQEKHGLPAPLVSLVLTGGERLPAAWCYWGWRSAGGSDSDAVIRAASALELLHGGALIHDDVLDGSALRRGLPAVHRQYASAHRLGHWRGAGTDFGVGAAILVGDLCLVWADELLRESGLPADVLRRAAPAFDAMREHTIRGRYLDLVLQAQSSLRAEDAWRAASVRAAGSATVGPLLFGAALAGGELALHQGLRAYAEPLGIACELRAELLAAFGDRQVAEQPPGDDARAGTATVLLARAAELGGAAVARRIRELSALGSRSAATELRALLDSTGARAEVAATVGRLAQQAVTALADVPIDDAARAVLGGLAQALLADESLRAVAAPCAG